MMNKTINEKVAQYLATPQGVFIKHLGAFMEDLGTKSYLVGGVVRDILLGRSITDCDLMVEGNVLVTLNNLQYLWSERFPKLPQPIKRVDFKRYKTAKLLFEDALPFGGGTLDFSSARKEVYPQPGKPPIVSEGTLLEDLSRRDFSVNAITVFLTKSQIGDLLDPFNGVEDLEAKQLKILHEKSFLDDPARLIRAVRFMVRFGFYLCPITEPLFFKAINEGYLQTLPTRRLFEEFKKVLKEREAFSILSELNRFNMLKQIIPIVGDYESKLAFFIELGLDKSAEIETEGILIKHWEALLCCLLSGVSDENFIFYLSSAGFLGKAGQRLARLRQILGLHYAS